MTTYYLEYPLQNGYIHNWLVAGPLAVPVNEPERFEADQRKLQIARHYHSPASEIAGPPVERGNAQVGDTSLIWRYWRCLDDHMVDLSTFHHTWHYLRAWAYTQMSLMAAQLVTLVCTTNGPADIWINGQHIHRQEHFHHQHPHSISFQAAMQEGTNEILVRMEEVAARECPYAMALRVTGLSDRAAQKAAVLIPTTIERTDRRQMFEEVFEHAFVEQNVLYKGNLIPLRWSSDLKTRCNIFYQIRDRRNRIYLEGGSEAQALKSEDAGHPARLWERPYFVVLMPPYREYTELNMRYERAIPVHVLDTEYTQIPYGTFEERRREALENAAKREGDVFAEIAKMELGQWDRLNVGEIMDTIARINGRGDCSDFYLVGLLGAMYRYMGQPSFPASLKQPLEACALGFKYWHDEPGGDAMCYTTENHSILFHTCEILAGQRYPDRSFANVGQAGQWHREKGERLALAWLRKRGTAGFLEWDSNCYFEEDLLALSHLADLAKNAEVRELAAVLMDKMFFILAVNSYQGVFGSTHGRTYAPMIRGGQLEATSGISRLMWGMGVWNHHIRAVVSLACSQYELPFIIADIAADQREEMWNRERIVGDMADWKASGSLGPEVNKVTYRTPDYMLCSAQDYHPGEKGYQQHIWQATLGPNAVVFVNHPPCASEEGAHRPNFWHGNAVLPRVAQWKDVLIALHNLSEDDWMGFTHAYFPTYAFDQYAIRDGWAFARKGHGYLALTAANGLELIKQGPGAYYELRSHGRHNTWLCYMGRTALDGGFDAFQSKVLGLSVNLQELSATCTTLRGETLSFGWGGPLTVQGVEQPIGGFKHCENPYCTADLPASEMDIRLGEYLLKLHFD